ncbi:hypothetical protein PR048_030476 [Dryococelus australis]|uniref:Uncharacterized protein n=1 Tax=Dryococelus australis TaxID=614101 RepID=A0ABQ9G933_9NEOP|nr:hypothetical protein PR048_030476 [Dryococelus australis]
MHHKLCAPITCNSVRKGVASYLCSSQWRNDAGSSTHSTVKVGLMPNSNANLTCLYSSTIGLPPDVTKRMWPSCAKCRRLLLAAEHERTPPAGSTRLRCDAFAMNGSQAVRRSASASSGLCGVLALRFSASACDGEEIAAPSQTASVADRSSLNCETVSIARRSPSQHNTSLYCATIFRLGELISPAPHSADDGPLPIAIGCLVSRPHPHQCFSLVNSRIPPRRTRFNPGPGHRIFARGNLAGRCRWSAGFLGDLPFPTPLFALKTSLLRAAQISSLTHWLINRQASTPLTHTHPVLEVRIVDPGIVAGWETPPVDI